MGDEQNSSPSTKRICMRNSMGFMQNTSPRRNLPTDVTLKLPDGTIEAHKMMLAYISLVFEKMFYGNFTEARSKIVDLRNDSHKIMKLLLDIVFEESCEMESLDDIIPLMEVVERYQINKAPVQQMCDEAILTQMNAKNYFVLLPKFAGVMHEDNIEIAANKIMKFTDNNFIASHNHAKCLPEEVLLPLLQHERLQSSCDLEIFEFLQTWYKYQTQHLGKSLHLTSQLFACVRYTRIIPQILTSRIASCNLVDKKILCKAYYYIYNSCNTVYCSGDKIDSFVSIFRRPMGCVDLKWEGFENVSLKHDYPSLSSFRVSGSFCAIPSDQYIVKSAPLADEIYGFEVTDILPPVFKMLLAISDASGHHLLSTPLASNSLITLYVYGRYAFLKVVDSYAKTVVSIFSVTGENPFSVRICRPEGCFKKSHTFSFKFN